MTLMSEEERKGANQWLVEYLQGTLDNASHEVGELRTKLAFTYWVMIGLSIIMFFAGIVLLSVPAVAAYRGEIGELQSLIAAGFGISDLAALFLFRPLERIHGLMGDMGQITLAINSFQNQVALRLLETDGERRETMGVAAEHINAAAKESILLIQNYFEARRPKR